VSILAAGSFPVLDARQRMGVSVKPCGHAVEILYDIFSEICRHGAQGGKHFVIPRSREVDSWREIPR